MRAYFIRNTGDNEAGHHGQDQNICYVMKWILIIRSRERPKYIKTYRIEQHPPIPVNKITSKMYVDDKEKMQNKYKWLLLRVKRRSFEK